MKEQILAFVMLLLLATPEAEAADRSAKIEPGVFALPLKLPQALESRRTELHDDVLAAEKNISRFAKECGWENLLDTPLVDSVEIFCSKENFDDYVRSTSPEMKNKTIPKTFSANADAGILIAVTPEVMAANSPNDREPEGYVKLLTHELAHRLEVRAVGGDEDKMGPIWFFEGFAVHAARQYEGKLPRLTGSQIWEIVGAKERGSYPKYRVVFEHFLKGLTMKEYLKHAGENDFIEWLHKRSDN